MTGGVGEIVKERRGGKDGGSEKAGWRACGRKSHGFRVLGTGGRDEGAFRVVLLFA